MMHHSGMWNYKSSTVTCIINHLSCCTFIGITSGDLNNHFLRSTDIHEWGQFFFSSFVCRTQSIIPETEFNAEDVCSMAYPISYTLSLFFNNYLWFIAARIDFLSASSIIKRKIIEFLEFHAWRSLEWFCKVLARHEAHLNMGSDHLRINLQHWENSSRVHGDWQKCID